MITSKTRIFISVILAAAILCACSESAGNMQDPSKTDTVETEAASATADASTDNDLQVEENKRSEEINTRLREGMDVLFTDPDKALTVFEKLADDGINDAVFLEGYIHFNIYSWNDDYEKRDLAKAKELFESVKEEIPYAEIELAGMYYQGDGCEKDEEKAVVMIKDAIGKIDEASIDELAYSSLVYDRLAYLYDNGIGVDQDKNKALEYYKKASLQNNPISMVTVARKYEQGTVVDQDFRIAKYWYWKAINAGSAEAMCRIGLNHERGTGVAVDLEKAFKWYERAAQLGNFNAINNLGYAYEQGLGVEQDKSKAFELYQKGADLGNTDLMTNLARCYLDGCGVERDYNKAVELYQKAVDQGNPHAMNDLAYAYEDGLGVEKDPEKAVQLYLKAFELGNITAMQNMTTSFVNGAGAEQDFVKAREIAERALDAGVFYAADFLAVLYDRGLGVEKNTQKAKELRAQSLEMEAQQNKEKEEAAEKADEDNSTEEMSPTGIEFLDNIAIMFTDPDTAKAYFEKEAESGNKDASFLVAYMNYAGLPKYDPEKALSMFEEMSDSNPYAKMCLGRMYYWGIKVEKDEQHGEELMDQAVSERDVLIEELIPYPDVVYYLLGDYYYMGANKDQYYKEAFDCFEKAQNNPRALNYLGLMYYNGDGVKRDMTKSIDYLEKAAGLGEGGSAEFLGRIYDEGMGVEADPQKAEEWYKKAEDLGVSVKRD